MLKAKVTRGHGVLEGFLARKRARMAKRLIPPNCPRARILDIGCGNWPFFLMQTDFVERYGVDRLQRDESVQITHEAIELIDHDIQNLPLPFADDHFDVVTMLAVIEHLKPDSATQLFREIRRVLKHGGVYIITTPAPWADIILRTMARLRLVSPEEIEEHTNLCSHKDIITALNDAGLAPDGVRKGSFELGMNLWVTARK